MRAVVQRVHSARIRVEGECVGEMGEGLLALVGVGRSDTREQAEDLARKLVHLRVFKDEQGRMNRSLIETGGQLGVVFLRWSPDDGPSGSRRKRVGLPWLHVRIGAGYAGEL